MLCQSHCETQRLASGDGAYCRGASLSGATGAHHRRLSCGWRGRHNSASDWSMAIGAAWCRRLAVLTLLLESPKSISGARGGKSSVTRRIAARPRHGGSCDRRRNVGSRRTTLLGRRNSLPRASGVAISYPSPADAARLPAVRRFPCCSDPPSGNGCCRGRRWPEGGSCARARHWH